MNRAKVSVGLLSLLLISACSESTPTPARRVSSSKSGADETASDSTSSKGKSSNSGKKTSGSKSSSDASDSDADDEKDEADKDSGMDTTPKPGNSEMPSNEDTKPVCDVSPGKAIKFVERLKDMIAGDLGADATLGDKPRTIELWAKYTSANSWSAEQSVIELGKPGQPDNGNNVFGIDMSGRNGNAGVFGPYTHGVSDNNGNNALPQYPGYVDAKWLHLSWSYDPSKSPANKRFEFTVNGNVLPTEFNQGRWDATGGKLVGNTGFVLLGASQNFGNGGWDGVMDEVRIWGVARTAQEIKDNMNVIVKPSTPGLIAYYQFNESNVANIKDSTGKESHKLSACAASGGACPSKNDTEPKFVDSDIPGAFTCGK